MRCCNVSAVIPALTLMLLVYEPPQALAEAEPSGDLSALLRRFAALPGLRADFREEKRIALLAAPLVNEGTLYFAPPRALLRRVRTPAPATVFLTGERLRVREGDRTEQIELRDNPVVRHFVQSFSLLLSGDEEALRRLYDIRFQTEGPPGESQPWSMTLRPRDAAMRRVLREVSLRGRGVVIEQMRVVERSGDESVTTFSHVDVSHRRSVEELERLFPAQ